MDDYDKTTPAVYEAVRTLLAKKQASENARPKPAPVKDGSKKFLSALRHLPGLVLSRRGVERAGSMILVFAGAALFLVYAPFSTGPREVDPAAAPAENPSGDRLTETSGIRETRVEPAVARASEPRTTTTADIPTRTTDPLPPVETFFVRVGSFRDEANAQRVVDSLRVRELSATLEVSSGGLHAVVVGPFTDRNLADTTARTVGQAMGLVPQVLERDPY